MQQNPTDPLESQSTKVLLKNSVFKSYYNELTVVKEKKVIYYSTKVGGGGG